MINFYPSSKTNFLFIPGLKALMATLIILLAVSAKAQSIEVKATTVAEDEFRSFDVQPVDKKIMLNWITSADKNTSHYVVQRSFNGKSFEDTGIIFTKEDNNTTNCSYKYADSLGSIKCKVIYYRLKMVELGGNCKYSETATVNLKMVKHANSTIYNNNLVSK